MLGKEYNYVREIDPINDYIRQMSTYHQLSDGISHDDAVTKVKSSLSTHKEQGLIENPTLTVNYYERGTRTKKTTNVSLIKYWRTIHANDLIVAPSLTTYLKPEVEKSLLAGYTVEGTVIRKGYKKEMFKAQALKNNAAYDMYDLFQNNVKFVINSISGTAGSKGTILSNETGHSTLTSVTRMVTSTGSMLAEKMLGGNRAYFNQRKVMFNLIYITSLLYEHGEPNQLHKDLKHVIDKYRLYIPTVNDLVDVIKHSTHRYWLHGEPDKHIKDYLAVLPEVVRCAIAYLGDLYHLRKYNPGLMRDILTEMTQKEDLSLTVRDLLSYKEDDIIHAHILNFDMSMGKGKEYSSLFSKEELEQLTRSAANIENVLHKYLDLFDTLCKNDHVNVDVARMGDMVRETVLLSDTDSTGLTTDDWVFWYKEDRIIDRTAYAIGSSLIYLFTTYLVHQLAKLSANIGVEKKEINRLAMKNEYFWSTFIVVQAKHYYASTVIREGNVFDKAKLEKKGVHLKNSALPSYITKAADVMMTSILKDIEDKSVVSISKYVDYVLDIEKHIQSSILKGEATYLKTLSIKTPDSYKAKDQNPNYQHHLFWITVFGDKYGGVSNPPYDALKLNIKLTNKTKTNEHLNGNAPWQIAWRNWLDAKDKQQHPTMYIPQEVLEAHGIIPEIIDVVDVDAITMDLCNIFYILLGSLGFHKPTLTTLTEYTCVRN